MHVDPEIHFGTAFSVSTQQRFPVNAGLFSISQHSSGVQSISVHDQVFVSSQEQLLQSTFFVVPGVQELPSVGLHSNCGHTPLLFPCAIQSSCWSVKHCFLTTTQLWFGHAFSASQLTGMHAPSLQTLPALHSIVSHLSGSSDAHSTPGL